ncbi:hypothetical protein ASG73_17300 [Janibacter sp. Soil728]|uniref:hypothetical protein n=1 Tax=Janibacter sp. Soil728 TaxID=1736393 RepID=UPI0006FA4A1C|nr:hypothetical protein [Janibacter sp. Soil728]KRE35009.1 hypothetical protein ASG73_17300 [Janibacter sp. Soil728]
MRAPHEITQPLPSPADAVFDNALGVVQNTKNLQILAVHTQGRKLVALEKAKMSNPKIYVVGVDDAEGKGQLHVVVGSDPRTRKALMDGKFNKTAAEKYVAAVEAAASGSAPAPSTPVANHYMQKKNQIPWEDANVEPEIDLGFSWLGLVAHMH